MMLRSHPRLLPLALGSFAIGTDGFMIAGILPRIAADAAVDIAAAGWLVTVFSLVYALGAPFLSTWTGTWNRKKLLTSSLLFFSAANFTAAFASGFGVLLVSRIAAAIGAALFTPVASATAAGLVPPEKRGRALALVTGGLTVAIVLGVPFGTWVGSLLDWRSTFGIVGFLGLIAAAGAGALLPQVPPSPSIPLRERLALAGKPQVILVLGQTFLYTVGGFAVYTYFAELIPHLVPGGSAWVGPLLLLFGVGSLAGNVLGGYGADRFGPMRTLIAGLLAISAALGMYTYADTVADPYVRSIVIVAATLLWGISGWMITPPQQYRIMSIGVQMPAVLLSLNGSAIYLGIAVGSLIGGQWFIHAGIGTLGLLGAVFPLAALLSIVSGEIAQRPNPLTGSTTAATPKADG